MIPLKSHSILGVVPLWLIWLGVWVCPAGPVVAADPPGLLTQAPVIVRQPQEEAVIDGDDATFVVVAFGAPTLEYAWTFNGEPVGTNSPMYVRQNCQLSDRGAEVRVKVSNGLGFVDSAPAKLSVRSGGTQYYISPSGSATNTGRSPLSPWTLRQALTVIGPSNTLNLMPGTYPSIRVSYHGWTLRSTTKWGAKIVGTPYTHGVHVFDGVDDLLIEDIHIASSHIDGIKLGGSHSTIRGCWIENAGRGHPFAVTNTSGLFTGQGISSHNYNDTLIENCLIEKCGMQIRFDHGIYASGTNVVIRGNVIRNNLGWGVQIYDSFGKNDQAMFHNNLVYGNGLGPLTLWAADGLTNFVFNNTLLGLDYCLIIEYGHTFLYNNILAAGPAWHPVVAIQVNTTLEGGYNLMNKPGNVGDIRLPNDFTAADPGFVDPSRGLYWLRSNSRARAASGPDPWPVSVDFFGGAQNPAAHTDLGAFAYDPALAADVRILEPSSAAPGARPDYWARPEAHDPSLSAFAGAVFRDANANGTRDSGESLLPAWNLELSGAASGAVASAASGRFAWANLPPGDYQLALEARAGWIQTSPGTGSRALSLAAGDYPELVEMGVVECPTNQIRIQTVRCETGKIWVEFSGLVSSESLRLASDFQFVPPLTVSNVEAQADGRTFAVSVTDLDPLATYTLTTSDVLDLCQRPSRIIPVKFSCNEVVLTTHQVDANTLLLLWVQPGVLQESDGLSGQWNDLSSAGYVMISSSNRHGFYRVVGISPTGSP
ncbi:MAG: right-handed parallel beta-helix repeat-containing protein [Verrucomicrobiales bacterium]|nr:right-handed parallel beta-helix repeat-containing protein [Verrucomicrobiales bacterium]